jgi:ABC-type phosphate transport system substrate-binding protein
MRSTLRKGTVAVLAGASAILSLTLGGTAAADPNLTNAGASLPGFLPDSNDVVGVGSDTIQYVVNTASQAQSSSNPSVRVASFNAFKPGTESSPVIGDTIVIRDPDQVANSGDEVTTVRPNGSGAGINALIATPQIDFARSSRFRGTAVAEQDLYFIPVLVDGLSYIVDKTAGSDIRNLDATELAAIYRCTDTRGYAPKLPQAGSGTRSFFLAQIGVTEDQVGGCVDKNVQEHDPSSVAGNAVALAPFSTARYVNNPPNPASPPSTVVDIAATASTTGVFFTTRTVYNVVRKADYDATGSRLPAIFGPDVTGSTGTGGYFCDRYANSGIARQGFTVAPNCGALL